MAEGAWQIRLPLPWELVSVNVFLFRRGDGYLLLDTGIKTHESLLSLQAALHGLDSGWSGIHEILVSHLHPDHVGAAAEIRRRSGAPVRMNALEAELVRPRPTGREFFAEAAEYLRCNGVPGEQIKAMRSQARQTQSGFERLHVDRSLEEGDRISFDGGTLETITVPGHSPAMQCFYCADQRVLFSTDAILPKVTPNIGVHWFYRGDPLGDYIRSLDRLESLDVRLVAPSHGRPFEGHRAWIENTRRHHEARCESILETMGNRTVDAYSIAGEIWGADRNLMDRRFAMAESLAHLEHMARAGRVAKTAIKGIDHWNRL